ncbi:MAG: GerMN domain-containing protein [Treponema sp.]|nr:GerMN domain-containing protein [Treponema sp.]
MIPFIALGIFSGALLFTCIRFITLSQRSRAVFYFDSYDSEKKCMESRYLYNGTDEEDIELFISEFLLGPMTNRLKNPFPAGTKLEFCTGSDDGLHVGLSKEALLVTEETYNIRENVELLKYNIVKNFTNVNKIFVYIDGKSISFES